MTAATTNPAIKLSSIVKPSAWLCFLGLMRSGDARLFISISAFWTRQWIDKV
jgi:hypothetical protein